MIITPQLAKYPLCIMSAALGPRKLWLYDYPHIYYQYFYPAGAGFNPSNIVEEDIIYVNVSR